MLPCCLFVDDDAELDADAEAYNCETCPVAEQLAHLDEDQANGEAWRVFHRIFSRFTVDTHIASVVLEHVLAGHETEDTLTLVDRFTLLYDILHPPPEPK